MGRPARSGQRPPTARPSTCGVLVPRSLPPGHAPHVQSRTGLPLDQLELLVLGVRLAAGRREGDLGIDPGLAPVRELVLCLALRLYPQLHFAGAADLEGHLLEIAAREQEDPRAGDGDRQLRGALLLVFLRLADRELVRG